MVPSYCHDVTFAGCVRASIKNGPLPPGGAPISRFNQLGYVPFVEVGRSAFGGHAIVIEPRHQRCHLIKDPTSSKGQYNRRISMDTAFGDLRVTGKLNGKETVFRVSFDSNTFLGLSIEF